MKGEESLALIYELDQISGVVEYVEAHPGARIVCLDFWVERELKKRGISYISLRDFMPAEDTEEEWWLLAQKIAREWYRLPAMKFFEYKGIRIGEAVEPMMEMYLSRLLYYVRICSALKELHPKIPVYVPAPPIERSSSAGPLAFFEQQTVADAVRMAGMQGVLPRKNVLSGRHLFPRSVWQALLVRAYNSIISLIPRRSFKMYASEYWSHIEPIITKMNDAEVVLMESSELKNVAWRDILKHRIRIRHPADAATRAIKRAAMLRSREYAEQWRSATTTVEQFLHTERAELNWSPALEACEYLVEYSARVVADIDGLESIMQEERPTVVLQRASIGGRQHHFFLMARIATKLEIPSVELQHAAAVFDPRSVHSRLEASYLAAYGEVEREQYVRNGYASRRIIAVGSPRFDQYRQDAEHTSSMRQKTLRSIGLDPTRRVVMVAVPAEQLGLSPLSFSSYDSARFFREIQNVRKLMPEVQFLFKFRHKSCTEQHRAYLRELFPEGGIAMVEGDPFPLICASDCVLSGNSTIMYEAMISKKPLILYPWKGWDCHLGIYGTVAPHARSEMELKDILQKIFSDESYGREIITAEQRFVERHSFDGHSAERMATLLRRGVF